MRKLDIAKKRAKDLNLNWQSLDISDKKGKRFKILNKNNKWIHFGLYPYAGKGTYIDHHDENIRKAWNARHMKIKNKNGYAYLDEDSPEYYSKRILW